MTLDKIVKLELLAERSSEEITDIWTSFHADVPDSHATTLSRSEHELLSSRLERAPMFVLPVRKDEGAYFTLLSQWSGPNCFLTFLEDYRQNPQGAEPWLLISMFGEFLADRDLSLVRATFSEQLTKPEAAEVLELWRSLYLGENFKHVEAFNAGSPDFDFDAVFKGHLASSPAAAAAAAAPSPPKAP